MWLLNVQTYRLHNFTGDQPQYAILSHCWEEDEVTFAEMRDCKMIEGNLAKWASDEERHFPILLELREYRRQKLHTLKGWQKIVKFCQFSQQYGLEWVWVDTICIDKSSSAELQEAINAMYDWYAKANMCVAYLHDVDGDLLNDRISTNKPRPDHPILLEIRDSKWFTRGWTLQELLAPCSSKLTFMNKDWIFIGTANTMAKTITQVTRIPEEIFGQDQRSKRDSLRYSHSAARRMSWASHRAVTRAEDIAYSLMGLFDVNMPLIYGEGPRRAFERLQLEILKSSEDESLLAWHSETPLTIDGFPCPKTLAWSPACFMNSSDIYRIHPQGIRETNIRLTPRGIFMEAYVFDRAIAAEDRRERGVSHIVENIDHWQDRFAAPLLCCLKDEEHDAEAIFIQMDRFRTSNTYTQQRNFFTSPLNWAVLRERVEKTMIHILDVNGFFHDISMYRAEHVTE